MQALNEKYMSDEETDAEDSNSFLKRSPNWRSEKLNQLIKKLDERYFQSRRKKDNSKPMKSRKTGTRPSDRSTPASAPDWAVITNTTDDPPQDTSGTTTSTVTGLPANMRDCRQATSTASSSRSSSPALSLSDNDLEDDAEIERWIASVSGFRT